MSLINKANKILYQTIIRRLNTTDSSKEQSSLSLNDIKFLNKYYQLFSNKKKLIQILNDIHHLFLHPNKEDQYKLIKNCIETCGVQKLSCYKLNNKKIENIFIYSDMPENIVIKDFKNISLKNIFNSNPKLKKSKNIFIIKMFPLVFIGYTTEANAESKTLLLYLETLLKFIFIKEMVEP